MRLPIIQYYINKATNEKVRSVRRISGFKEDMEDDTLLNAKKMQPTLQNQTPLSHSKE